MNKHDFQLLPFQQQAVMETVEAICRYNGDENKFTCGSNVPSFLEGKPKPYLHRIRAITGAGKTPILAAISSYLKDCIILWTTPRGAVIEQTTQNLNGKYNSLLQGATEVLSLDETLKSAAWNRIIEQKQGCTIITTTVAAFNQKGSENLTIHKGSPSPWQQLCEEVHRNIWVFYDEGHNATENQFQRLLELRPKGFLLASASPLAADLQNLLPGEDAKAKEAVLNAKRTTIVDTKQVVAAGLLKRSIEIHDLDTADKSILQEAYNKREYLAGLCDDNIIACYIVDRDALARGVLHGLSIWEQLCKYGADPMTIAVHLSGAKQAAEEEMKRGKPYFRNLVATYDYKLTPEKLKECGFKHIIWNLSLEEGWDEPWAYVGYFHGEQANENKVIQRIGRLIRNPFKNSDGSLAIPAADPLRSVYCYLNTTNDILKNIVDRLQAELATDECLEVLIIKETSEDKKTSALQPKKVLEIPKLSLTFDPCRLEAELYATLFNGPKFSACDYRAEGKATIVTTDIGIPGSTKQQENIVGQNIPTTVAQVVKDQLLLKDSRLTRKRGSLGGWLSPRFWCKEGFDQELDYSSKAYFELKRRCDQFVDCLDKYLDITIDDQEDPYQIEPMNLINPDGGNNDKQKKYYKVHSFRYALHQSYNCLNDFELQVANELDRVGIDWVRNPARIGFGIPLVHYDNTSVTFFPDFVAWSNGKIFFIETKGRHLLEEAKKFKLIHLPYEMELCLLSNEHGLYKMVQKSSAGRPHEQSSYILAELLASYLQREAI